MYQYDNSAIALLDVATKQIKLLRVGKSPIKSWTVNAQSIGILQQNGSLSVWKQRRQKRIWQKTKVCTEAAFIVRSLVFAEKTLVCLCGRSMIAMSRQTGRVKWTRLLNSRATSPIAYHQRKLFFGTKKGQYFVLALETGQIVWRIKLPRNINSLPTFMGDDVFISDRGRNIHRLYVPKRMHKVWFRVQKNNHSIQVSPIVDLDSRMLFIIDSSSVLYGINI